MPRNHKQEFEFLNEKCSFWEVRRFVSDALQSDGVGIVNYPSGNKAAYGVRYICDVPTIGRIKKPSLLEEIIKKQAEKLVSERRQL